MKRLDLSLLLAEFFSLSLVEIGIHNSYKTRMDSHHMPSELKISLGDIVYWDGTNPDGTKEVPCFYVVTSAGEGLEDIALMDGFQNFLFPDQAYTPHLRWYSRDQINNDTQLLGGLPRRLQEEFRKYAPKG